MEGSVLSFLRAEWKVSDTGSAQCWASSFKCQLCSGPSFTQGWKDFGAKTYLFTACANCYLRFWAKVIFKTEYPVNLVVAERICSIWMRIQQLTWSLIFYEKYSTSQSDLWFWNFHWPDKKIAGHRTTANFEHCNAIYHIVSGVCPLKWQNNTVVPLH
jgi:hypothetical protein